MAMNKEYFWAEELNSKKNTITWNPTLADDEDDSFDESSVQHFLFLKQAVLGPDVTDKERCVVEVTSEDIDGDTIKQPLFSLRLGLNESATLDVGFQPPVTFHLMKGDGPVYLSGQHALELQDDKLDDFEDEDDEEEDETVEEEKLAGILDGEKTKKRKRPFDTPSDKNKKKQPKLDQSASSGKTSEDEDDDDDESDEDFDPKTLKKGAKASKEDDDEEDDDDDDFEDMEDDDDDEDDSDEDEEDDDDEEDEEEEEETPKVNLKKSKNQKQQKKNTKMNGKATKVEAKTSGGGDAKAKETQKKKGGKPQTIQEIKDDIAKSPGKPKKEVKFFNYVKNTYRVTDQQKLQELWNWHKNTNL